MKPNGRRAARNVLFLTLDKAITAHHVAYSHYCASSLSGSNGG